MPEKSHPVNRILAGIVMAAIIFTLGWTSGVYWLNPPVETALDFYRSALIALSLEKPEPAYDHPEPPGKWHVVQEENQNKLRRNNQLNGLGYLSGYQEASDSSGVLTHDPASSWNGVNFYVSGHDHRAYLMNMNGDILHTWSVEFDEAFPNQKPRSYKAGPYWSRHWRKGYLYPNGDLIAILSDHGMIKMDKDSNVLWSHYNHAHHDLDVGPDGKIYTLTLDPDTLTVSSPNRRILDDYVTVYDDGGKLIERYSLIDAIKNSQYRSLLSELPPDKEDVLHTNTVDVLPAGETELPEGFSGGDLLLSFREIDTIAVFDLESEQITWALSGVADAQHDPDLLPNGNLLIFDNGNFRKESRVIELDPITHKIHWGYGSEPSESFYTKCCGTNQRLPNGNTLIVDTDSGTAFEVTPAGRTVWAYSSPHRAGENNELVASLFQVQRFSTDYVNGWLGEKTLRTP